MKEHLTTILTTTVGNVTIKTTLYGPMTSSRYAKEQAIIQHRAEQLNSEKPKPTAKPRRMSYNRREMSPLFGDPTLGYA